ncbi:transglycosylase SLT domain-containing protein [Palleronia sp. LCG004]|uniref:transglycosylase SLT domain-containing protein n=1 Tax=Palleronia sp. LCG004 TaxID=3079304 RepID=UPI0029435F15|nr:transglycosylase SLT domain-containing protein [Palleronia sp. LCG004]WOI55298.1 transglycosylase SLT domain-containing protein [Palleronia sp. LCG004]
MMRRLAILLCLLLPACATVTPASTPEAPTDLPVARWDFRPESNDWTEATLAALKAHGSALPRMVPADYAQWCPGYPDQSAENRAAFWTGLMSALAKHESTWNPEAVGGGGAWYGLVQIAPATARGYGCDARTGSALKDGVANLRCAVRIAAAQVSRRGSIDRGMRDWGPFHSSAKRAEMSAWTRAQSYCQKPV